MNKQGLNIFRAFGKVWTVKVSGMNKQAEELAEKCLARSDFDEARKSNFWCIKGDIHDDESFYQKAWELSRGRNAKSMRSLGALLVHRKKYEEAADAFAKGKT